MLYYDLIDILIFLRELMLIIQVNQKSVTSVTIGILQIKGLNEAINIMQKIDLIEKSRTL